LAILAAAHISTANRAELTKDRQNNNLHMKFSKLNVNCNRLSFNHLSLKSLPYGASNLGTPSKCAISATVN